MSNERWENTNIFAYFIFTNLCFIKKRWRIGLWEISSLFEQISLDSCETHAVKITGLYVFFKKKKIFTHVGHDNNFNYFVWFFLCIFACKYFIQKKKHSWNLNRWVRMSLCVIQLMLFYVSLIVSIEGQPMSLYSLRSQKYYYLEKRRSLRS